MRVLIVGAGIGGLTAAIALRRAGIDAVVLEQAPELREVGAGISLWPNAINAFRRLGVGDAVEATGARVADTEICDWRGRSLHRSSSDLIEARFGAPLIMVRRAALHSILRDALDPERAPSRHQVRVAGPGRHRRRRRAGRRRLRTL